VIVVNDGSTDGTLLIANGYKARHPNAIRVVDKANGGHGSGINIAARIAAGKYFRPIDADDRAVNVEEFVEALSESDSDIVLTNFQAFDEISGKSISYKARGLGFGRKRSMEAFWRLGKRSYPVCKYHSVTYRTDFYRQCRMELPEGIFYGDEIYSTVPFKYAKSILPLDLFLYEYRLGNSHQSVSDLNAFDRIGDLERVMWEIHSELPNGGARGFFRYKLRQVALAMHAAALLKSGNKLEGLQWAREFAQRTKARNPQLWLITRKQYFVSKLISNLGINGASLSKYRFNGVYHHIRQLLM
jgi:glycosyltransferase involved in cell wall biosynthesis